MPTPEAGRQGEKKSKWLCKANKCILFFNVKKKNNPHTILKKEWFSGCRKMIETEESADSLSEEACSAPLSSSAVHRYGPDQIF